MMFRRPGLHALVIALIMHRRRPTWRMQSLRGRAHRPEHRQFDFWLGDWQVTRRDGVLAGINRIALEYGGCVIHERYATGKGYSGESLNVYDATRKVWHQTRVDSNGLLLTLEGPLGRQGHGHGRPFRATGRDAVAAAHHLDAERRRQRAPAVGSGERERRVDDRLRRTLREEVNEIRRGA